MAPDWYSTLIFHWYGLKCHESSCCCCKYRQWKAAPSFGSVRTVLGCLLGRSKGRHDTIVSYSQLEIIAGACIARSGILLKHPTWFRMLFYYLQKFTNNFYCSDIICLTFISWAHIYYHKQLSTCPHINNHIQNSFKFKLALWTIHIYTMYNILDSSSPFLNIIHAVYYIPSSQLGR